MSSRDFKVKGEVSPSDATVSSTGMLQTSEEVIAAEFKYPSGSCVCEATDLKHDIGGQRGPTQYQFPHQTSE